MFRHLPQRLYYFIGCVRFALANPRRNGLKFVPMYNYRDQVAVNVTFEVTSGLRTVTAYRTLIIAIKRVIRWSQPHGGSELVLPIARKVDHSARATYCSFQCFYLILYLIPPSGS